MGNNPKGSFQLVPGVVSDDFKILYESFSQHLPLLHVIFHVVPHGFKIII